MGKGKSLQRRLSKDTQPLSKHRERCSAPLVVGDVRVRCHMARMAPSKTPQQCVAVTAGGNGRPRWEQFGRVLSCTVNTLCRR